MQRQDEQTLRTEQDRLTPRADQLAVLAVLVAGAITVGLNVVYTFEDTVLGLVLISALVAFGPKSDASRLQTRSATEGARSRSASSSLPTR